MTLAEVCVKRPVFAVMLISFLVVLGIFSFRDLGVDLFPKADPATVTINARLPGATPEEMTTQVVFPLEEAVSTISGLDELTAMIFEGAPVFRAASSWSAKSKAPPRMSGRRSQGPYASSRRTCCPPSFKKLTRTQIRSSPWS